jgi:Kef-type K+ transport system membrane component KefB
MRARDAVAPIVCAVLAVALIAASVATGRLLLGFAGGACAVLAVLLLLGPFVARRIFRLPPAPRDDDTPPS